MRTRLSEIVHRPKHGDTISRLYDFFIVVVALLSIAPALFHANSLHKDIQDVLGLVDVVTAYILSFDYLLRWMTCDIEAGKRGRVREFVKYPFTFGAIVDLLSILPTINILPSGFLFLRALRIVRLFRYSRQLAIIVNVFVQERKTLGSVLMLAIAYILATALIMFTFEPSTFDSFTDALYWATITLTTVGFGDIHPTSDLGHVLTSVSSIFGIFIFALPAGIMTGGFLQQLRQKEEEGEEYYEESFFSKLKPGKLFLRPKNAKEYFRTHPKVVLYARFIFAGIAVNFLLCLFFSELWQPLWLDTAGTAMVACMLDPAAAIIVSFVDNLIIAVYQNNPQSLLYFSESALVALVYAFMYRRGDDGRVPLRNAGKVLLVIVLSESAISFFLTFWLSHGVFTTPYQEGYRVFFTEQGVNYYLATFLALIVDRTFDAVSVFVLVNLSVLLMNKVGFFPKAWLARRYAAAGVRPPRAGDGESSAPARKDGAAVKPGVLSAQDEALCLSRDGLRRVVSNLRKEARRVGDPVHAESLFSAADAISLLSRADIKSEDEFRRLLDEKAAARRRS